jgi:poly(3-hydroxybutyrate) depolymerase
MLRKLALGLSLLTFVGSAACGDDGGTGGDGSGGASSASTGTTSSSTSSTTGSTTVSTTTSTTTSTGTTTSSTTSGTGGGPQGCLMDLTAGHKKVSCAGGIAYDVEIPAACTNGPCGLIVDMHGYTMTADSEEENTGMRAIGQANDYVVVQPTAPKDSFQLPSWDQATHAPLVHQFMVDLAASLPIDPSKVHAMGFSQGGGMTFRLLCDYADFFASGAPIGAIEGCQFSGQDTPSEEVDILQVHGRTDAIVSFQGTAVPQRDKALAAWAFGSPSVLEDDGAHKATRWTTNNGTVFEFWEHDYQSTATLGITGVDGHCVPGGTDFSGFPAYFSCAETNTFVFGQLAMQFFIAHPKS